MGKLVILINNAATAGHDLRDRDSKTIREVYTHCYSVNTISAAVLTEKMIPLLQKAKVPRIVFIPSELRSIDGAVRRKELVDVPSYNTKKSALNGLCAYYTKEDEKDGFKVNVCCPRSVHTGLDGTEAAPHARNGAISACRQATELDGPTGTYTNKEGMIPW